MLIACRFKRPNAPVDLGDKVYFFKPVDPANADSEHVAMVEDKNHIQRLLQIPEAYYIAVTELPPTVAKPVAAAAGSQPAKSGTGEGGDPGTGNLPPANDQTGEGNGDANSQIPPPKELQEQGEALNGLSWQALQGQLKKGGIDKAVIKIALEIEQAKPEADQRATTLKFLLAALEA